MKYYKLNEEEKEGIEEGLTQLLIYKKLLGEDGWIDVYDLGTVIFGVHYYQLMFDIGDEYEGKTPYWDTKRIKFMEKLISSKVNAKDDEAIFLTDEQIIKLHAILKLMT